MDVLRILDGIDRVEDAIQTIRADIKATPRDGDLSSEMNGFTNEGYSEFPVAKGIISAWSIRVGQLESDNAALLLRVMNFTKLVKKMIEVSDGL